LAVRADDYQRAIAAWLGSVGLAGRASPSLWDDWLAPAMESAGLAIYEEQVIGELLGNPAKWSSPAVR
jgi:hypothetical protein